MIRTADVAAGVANMQARLSTIREVTKADELWLARSCTTRRYWRHDVDQTYKQQRSKAVRPIAIDAVADAATRFCDRTMRVTNLEADDVLSIVATTPELVENCCLVLVSGDKDLNQIPGLHLNPDKLERGIYQVGTIEGRRHHMWQTLVGDSVDNYPGCPGIGPVKASATLDDVEDYREMWDRVVATFKAKGLTAKAALVQARLSYMPHHKHARFNKKGLLTGVRLWTAPKKGE